MYLPMIGASSFFTLSGTWSGRVMMAVASASLQAHVRGPLSCSTAAAIVRYAVSAFCVRFAMINSTVTES